MSTDVEPHALRSAAAGSRAASDVLVGAASALRGLSAPSSVPLAGATRMLRDACATSVALVAEDATAIADRLVAAAELYELTDEAVEGGVRPR